MLGSMGAGLGPFANPFFGCRCPPAPTARSANNPRGPGQPGPGPRKFLRRIFPGPRLRKFRAPRNPCHVTATPRPGNSPRPARGGPGPREGCSSYQRLSKFARIARPPILKPGLRGFDKKTKTKRRSDVLVKNTPKKG